MGDDEANKWIPVIGNKAWKGRLRCTNAGFSNDAKPESEEEEQEKGSALFQVQVRYIGKIVTRLGKPEQRLKMNIESN
jgi:hypothetical protein